MWETRRSPRQTTCGLGHSRAPTPAGPGSPCRPRPDSPPWRPLLIYRRSPNVLGQKVSDRCRDLACVGLECEVAGVEQPHLSVAVVALERLGTRREEKTDRSCPTPRAAAVGARGSIRGTSGTARHCWRNRGTGRAG